MATRGPPSSRALGPGAPDHPRAVVTRAVGTVRPMARDRRRTAEHLLDGLDADPARRGRPSTRRSRSSPGPDRARRASSPAGSRGGSRTGRVDARARARGHLHPQGRRRAPRRLGPRRRRRRAATGAASPRARSTPSRSRSCAAAPTARPADARGCSSARCGCSSRSSAGAAPRRCARRRRARRARSSGPRPAWSRPTATRPRPQLAGRDAAPAAPRSSPTSTRATSARSAGRGLVDFDDLLWWCADALESDDRVRGGAALALPAPLRRRVPGRRARRSSGSSAAGSATAPTSCVVGDPDQAIYVVRRRRPRRPHRASADAFPGARVVRLDRNYRSTPADRRGRRGAARRRRRPPPAPCAPCAPTAPPPVVTAYDDDDDEAAGVAARLRDAHGHAASVVVARGALPHQRAVGGVRGGAHRGGRPVPRARRRAVPRPARGAGRARRAPRRRRGRARAARSPTTSPTSSRRRRRPPSERREHVDARRAGSAASTSPPRPDAASLDGFLACLTTVAARRGTPTSAATRSSSSPSTAPRASSSTPCSSPASSAASCRSRTPTRPRRAPRSGGSSTSRSAAPSSALQLSWARQRTLGTRVVGRAPSPWLAPIEARARRRRPRRTGARGARRARRGPRPPGVDSTAPTPDDRDPALLAALVEWRRGLARASSVPAYVIFHDTTLRAIADAHARRAAPRCSTCRASGPVKVERYGDAVLDLVREHGNHPVIVSA